MALPGAALWLGALLMKAARLTSAWLVALRSPAGYAVQCVSSLVRGCAGSTFCLQSDIKACILHSLSMCTSFSPVDVQGTISFLMLHGLYVLDTWHPDQHHQWACHRFRISV